MKFKVMFFLKKPPPTNYACDFLGLGFLKKFIDVAFGKTKTYQHLIHDLLKIWKGILQTKWKKIQLVQIILPMEINSQKCHLDLVPSFNDN